MSIESLLLDLFSSDYSGDLLRNVAIAFAVLETVAVGLRFASLRLSNKPFGIDDLLTIPGYLCCLSLIILSLVGINVGKIGYHVGFVMRCHHDAIIPWGKCMYATPILYAAACCFPRVTLLTLYLRIFGKHRPYRIACYTLMALLISLAVAVILVAIFICLPLGSFWQTTTVSQLEYTHCVNLGAFYRYGTLPNPILDVFILALPQPIVWKLQLPRQAKIGLAITFLTGSIGTVTSVCRCVAYFKNEFLADGTWLSVTFLKWSIIETGVYLIASCLPCYRPLIWFVLERSRSISSRYHTKGSNVSSSSSGPRDTVVYDKPPQIPSAVIDSRTDLEMSVSDPSHQQRGFVRHSDEESLDDLEYRT